MTGEPKPRRGALRLPTYDYSHAGAYFVTIVTQSRALLFEKSECRDVVDAAWWALPLRFPRVELDSYVVMPNHFHGILTIAAASVGAIHESPSSPAEQRRQMLLPKAIGYFKMNSAKQINLLRGTPGLTVWQRNYYEHVVRNEVDLDEIRVYIENNPARWELDEENAHKGRSRGDS